MNRAFHVGGIVWLLGTLLTLAGGLPPLIGVALGAGALILCALFGKLPLWVWATAVAFLGCTASALCDQQLVRAPEVQHLGEGRTLRGAVIEMETYPGWSRVTMLTALDLPAGLRGRQVRFSVGGALEAEPGDVVEYTGTLSRPVLERQMLSRDLAFEVTGYGQMHLLEENDMRVRVLLAKYRQMLYGNLIRLLPGGEGATLGGVLLGKTEHVSAVLRENYARSGLSHLQSVSGLHLAVVAGLLEGVLRALRFSRRQRSLAVMLGVFAFMGLAGFSSSVVRAGIMVMLCQCAGLFGRDSDSLNALGCALILLLMANPYAAFSLSLQLSYLATLGIALFLKPMTRACSLRMFGCTDFELEETRPKRFLLLQSVCTTVAATMLTIPLLCWNFGQFSLVSPLANLLAAPLEPILLGCGLAAAAAAFVPVLEPFARLSALGAGMAARQLDELASELGSLPFASVPVREGWVVIWMTGALLVAVLLWSVRASGGLKRYAAALMGLSLLAGAGSQVILRGDAITLCAPMGGGTLALVYGKQAALLGVPSSTMESKNLCAFLRESGVEQVILLVAEYDDDFYSTPAAELLTQYPAETAFGLDATYGFSGELFGGVRISARGRGAGQIEAELGGLRIVKTFEQESAAAHLLVNGRNEFIAAPGLEISPDRRYFFSAVLRMKLPERNETV